MDFAQDDLARSVAAEMGSDVADETEKAIHGEATRTFGLTEAMAVGSFIAQCAEVAILIHTVVKDRVALAARLEAEVPASPKLDDARRRSIIRRIAEKLTGGSGA